MNKIQMDKLNEMADIMDEHLQAIDAIWSSDKNYMLCADEVIKEYAACMGQLAAKITVMKIEAKKGLL
jgi:hypothetical protein